jgi:hypothetical protein
LGKSSLLELSGLMLRRTFVHETLTAAALTAVSAVDALETLKPVGAKGAA